MSLEDDPLMDHETGGADVTDHGRWRLELNALPRRDVPVDAPLHHHRIGGDLRRHFGAFANVHRILCADFPFDVPVDAHAALEGQLALHSAAVSEMRLHVARTRRRQRRRRRREG
jgi:hypothetical protein